MKWAPECWFSSLPLRVEMRFVTWINLNWCSVVPVFRNRLLNRGMRSFRLTALWRDSCCDWTNFGVGNAESLISAFEDAHFSVSFD